MKHGTYHSLIFNQDLIVFGNSHQEDDGSNILKAMNPLLSFRALTTDIKHAVSQVTNNEGSFGNTGCLNARSKNVLITWSVTGVANAIYGIKVAIGRDV